MLKNELQVFEIPQDVLNTLISSEMGLTWGTGSLLEGINADKNIDLTSYKSFLSDDAFLMLSKIITDPDHWIVQRTGGGQTALQAAHIYASDQVSNTLVLVTIDQESGAFLLQLHRGVESFAHWITEHFCSSSQELAVNYMPPKLNLSQFFTLIHLIDSYKRITFHSMLQYRYTDIPKISTKEFFKTLGESLASSDIRWLLPTITTLVPAINKYNYRVEPEDLKILLELDFVDGIVPDDQGGELILSNIGIYNGIEFLKNWMVSLGFECYHLVQGKRVLNKMFYIAPSRVTNHMVEFLVNEQEVIEVNHQVYTKELLNYKLSKIIEDVTKAPMTILPNTVENMTTNTGQEFCSQCGSKLLAEAKFCNACGAKVN